MLRANQLDVDRAFVLLIDLQEKLIPLIRGHDRVLTACRRLLEGAGVFQLPVVVTEQYPKGLGPTHASVQPALSGSDIAVYSKTAFSAWAEPSVRRALMDMDRPQVLIAGIETHVCIQQTALDMVSRDYDVFVCADAVGSRGLADHRIALHRMRHEHVVITTAESVLFELCTGCDAPRFPAMLEIIKRYPPVPVGPEPNVPAGPVRQAY